MDWRSFSSDVDSAPFCTDWCSCDPDKWQKLDGWVDAWKKTTDTRAATREMCTLE